VEAYRTSPPEGAAAAAAEILEAADRPHWITFTSSSTVHNFLAVAGTAALEGVRVASIGPVTSATARELGIQVAVEAPVFTVDGLVQAILDCISASR
jgi:uroporphyrinogen III methyltransferase/synthase